MKVLVSGVEETKAFTYRFTRGINRNIDIASVLVNDANGDMTRAYTPNTKLFKPVVIEDPTGTKLFDGRIRDIVTRPDFLNLECQGWLSQLDDVNIAEYTTKELLKTGTSYREAKVGSVLGYEIQNCTVGTSENPNWATNQWVGYGVVFPDVGAISAKSAPIYCVSASGFEIAEQPDHNKTHDKDWDDNWDNRTTYCLSYKSGTYYMVGITLTFQTSVPKEDIVDMHIYVKYGAKDHSTSSAVKLRIYDFAHGVYDDLASHNDVTGIYDESFDEGGDFADHINDSGVIYIDMWKPSGSEGPNTIYVIDYCKIVIYYSGSKVEMTFPITANTDNDVTSSQSFEDTGILGNSTFHICKKTTEHVKYLAQTYDIQKTIDVTNVVTTPNYRARTWKEPTALDIISDLATEDNTDYWLDLDQKLYYNKSLTASRTIDGDDIIIDPELVTLGSMMKNEAHIWGHKYSDTVEVHEVRVRQDSKDSFGITRSLVERDTTIYTGTDAQARGDSLLSKTAFPRSQYRILLPGKKNADNQIVDIGELVRLVISKYGVDTDLFVAEKSYDPTADRATYTLCKLGSSAGYYLPDILSAMMNLGLKVNRLSVQAAERE